MRIYVESNKKLSISEKVSIEKVTKKLNISIVGRKSRKIFQAQSRDITGFGRESRNIGLAQSKNRSSTIKT